MNLDLWMYFYYMVTTDVAANHIVIFRVMRTSIQLLLQYFNLACYFLWVWNLVADIAGGKEAEGVWQQGVEENIWT